MYKTKQIKNPVEELEAKGLAYRKKAAKRLKLLEEAVFRNPPEVIPTREFDANTMIARVERLEAAMTWWKRV